MRHLLLLAVLAIPSLLPAQGQSGRHFLRTQRAPVTAAADATQVTDAAVRSQRVEPLRRLRSGRAWSAFHFSRRPVTPAAGAAATTVEASAARGTTRRSPFWGRRIR